MTRLPRWGRGKRRLAAEAGERVAWRFQRLALAALLRRLGGDRRWCLELAVTPDAAARGPGRWARGLRRRPQGGGDLGARMLRQLGRRAPRGGAVLLVGADVPGIDRASVARAFALLRGCDWVVGPAADGGYWAIGTRRRPWRRPDFRGIAWGGPQARAQTLARLRGSVALLEERVDVDCAADLPLWREGRG